MRRLYAFHVLITIGLANLLCTGVGLAETQTQVDSEEQDDGTDQSLLPLALANEEAKKGNLQAAFRALEDAPPTLDVILLRAKIMLWSNEPRKASTILLNAPEPIRASLDARVTLGETLLKLDDLQGAKRELDGVLKQSPGHPDATALRQQVLARQLEASQGKPMEQLTYLAEKRSFEAPPATQQTEQLIIETAEKLPEDKRQAAIVTVQKSWPKTVARERYLLELEKRWGLWGDAFNRLVLLLEEPDAPPELKAMAGDVACAAAWNALGNKEPKVALAIAKNKYPKKKPNCLLIAQAQSELILQNFAASAAVYAALRKRDPDNLDVLFGSAEAALSGNELETANGLLSILEENPSSDKDRVKNLRLNYDLRSANSALQLGEPEKAETFARHGLTQSSTSPDAYLLLAAALQNQKRNEEAHQVLLAGIAADPSIARLYAALARLPGKHDHVAAAKQAQALPTPDNPEAQLDLQLALGDALIQEDDLDQARQVYENLLRENPNNGTVGMRISSVSMRAGDPFSARKRLQAIHEQDPSFSSALALADAHHALSLDAEAYRLVNEALRLNPQQPDARRFLKRLDFAHAPAVEIRATHTWDNGTNLAWEYGVLGHYDPEPDTRLTLDVVRRTAHTQATKESAQQISGRITAEHQLGARVALIAGGGVTYATSEESSAPLPLATARMKLRVGSRHRMAISLDSDTFSYTAGMIAEHVGLHSASLTANGPIYKGLSFYTALNAAFLTDDNSRGIVFGSIYYDFLNQPTIKAGVNGQILGFGSTTVRSYFSPGRLVNVEGFAEVLQADVEARFLYGALAAFGMQQIEALPVQNTYRFGAMLGVKPLVPLKLMIKGQTSNSAATTISGFRYFEVSGFAEYTFD